jgi:hypothetical protein
MVDLLACESILMYYMIVIVYLVQLDAQQFPGTDKQAHTDNELQFIPYRPSASPSPGPIVVSVPRRKPGRPKKTKPAEPRSKPATTDDQPSTPEPEIGSFSVVLLVLQKDQQMKAKGRKAGKVLKVESKAYGPVDVSMDATWTVFLECVRGGIPRLQDVRQLRIDTFDWYFAKRDINLPLRSESNLRHAVTRLQSRKANQEKLIYLEMQALRQIQQQEEEHLVFFFV